MFSHSCLLLPLATHTLAAVRPPHMPSCARAPQAPVPSRSSGPPLPLPFALPASYMPAGDWLPACWPTLTAHLHCARAAAWAACALAAAECTARRLSGPASPAPAACSAAAGTTGTPLTTPCACCGAWHPAAAGVCLCLDVLAAVDRQPDHVDCGHAARRGRHRCVRGASLAGCRARGQQGLCTALAGCRGRGSLLCCAQPWPARWRRACSMRAARRRLGRAAGAGHLPTGEEAVPALERTGPACRTGVCRWEQELPHRQRPASLSR